MARSLILVGSFLLLGGCGLGETAISTTAGGASQVQQARDAKATEERFRQQMEQGMRGAEKQREADDAAASP